MGLKLQNPQEFWLRLNEWSSVRMDTQLNIRLKIWRFSSFFNKIYSCPSSLTVDDSIGRNQNSCGCNNIPQLCAFGCWKISLNIRIALIAIKYNEYLLLILLKCFADRPSRSTAAEEACGVRSRTSFRTIVASIVSYSLLGEILHQMGWYHNPKIV